MFHNHKCVALVEEIQYPHDCYIVISIPIKEVLLYAFHKFNGFNIVEQLRQKDIVVSIFISVIDYEICIAIPKDRVEQVKSDVDKFLSFIDKLPEKITYKGNIPHSIAAEFNGNVVHFTIGHKEFSYKDCGDIIIFDDTECNCLAFSETAKNLIVASII